mmetsp:Transcript_6986/g.11016  ORF Transcript_6986/g.11016 Transcript_6986/m.11016 type:complete len:95 (+) Transcript_6986:501-785(+)
MEVMLQVMLHVFEFLPTYGSEQGIDSPILHSISLPRSSQLVCYQDLKHLLTIFSDKMNSTEQRKNTGAAAHVHCHETQRCIHKLQKPGCDYVVC